MFTKQYYVRLINSHTSKLSPIDELVRSVFFSRKLKKDVIINANNSSLSKSCNEYKYKTVATGLKKEDLSVYVEGSSLIITTKEVFRNNKLPDPFSVVIDHKIKLKEKVDKDNITLILSNGILEVIVPFKNF